MGGVVMEDQFVEAYREAAGGTACAMNGKREVRTHEVEGNVPGVLRIMFDSQVIQVL